MELKELKKELLSLNEEVSEAQYSVKYIQKEIDLQNKEIDKDYEERYNYLENNIKKLEKQLSEAKEESHKNAIKMFIKENMQEQDKAIINSEIGPSAQFVEKLEKSLEHDKKVLAELTLQRQEVISKIKEISPDEFIPEPKLFNPNDHFQVKKHKYPLRAYIGTFMFFAVVIIILLKACGKM